MHSSWLGVDLEAMQAQRTQQPMVIMASRMMKGFQALANAGFMTIRIDQKVHTCTITSSEADSDLAGAVRAGESVDKLGQYPVFL